MKKTLILATLALILMTAMPTLASDSAKKVASEVKGDRHVAFFFTAGMEYKEHRAAYADFIFSYEGARDALEGMGFTYSYHSRLPIKIPNGSMTLSLGKKNLSQSAGVIFIKSNGRFRVVYGVYKSTDITDMAREYFGRRP